MLRTSYLPNKNLFLSPLPFLLFGERSRSRSELRVRGNLFKSYVLFNVLGPVDI